VNVAVIRLALMNESEFKHRNQQVYLAFVQFDLTMIRMAKIHSYDFDHKCGPSRGRSLHLREHNLRKMVCFDIENSILDVDLDNLQVHLGWGVWLQEFTDQRLPFWFLKRDYYTGSINDLPVMFEMTLAQMLADLNSVTRDQVKDEGEYHSAVPI